jgi:hypothetical protein
MDVLHPNIKHKNRKKTIPASTPTTPQIQIHGARRGPVVEEGRGKDAESQTQPSSLTIVIVLVGVEEGGEQGARSLARRQTQTV